MPSGAVGKQPCLFPTPRSAPPPLCRWVGAPPPRVQVAGPIYIAQHFLASIECHQMLPADHPAGLSQHGPLGIVDAKNDILVFLLICRTHRILQLTAIAEDMCA